MAGLIDLEGLTIAGSHGFDILHADGRRDVRAEEYRQALTAAADELDRRLGDTPGVRVERKRFAIAVHYREVAEEDQTTVMNTARGVGDSAEQLRVTGGKKIVEVRPDFEWDKGKALEYLLKTFDLDRDDVAPLHVGDDVTDEDAFRAIHDRGVGIVVKGEDDLRPTAAHLSLPDTDAVGALLVKLRA